MRQKSSTLPWRASFPAFRGAAQPSDAAFPALCRSERRQLHDFREDAALRRASGIDPVTCPGTIDYLGSIMASILPGRRTAISLPSERPKGAGQPCLVIISGAEMGRRSDLTHEEVSIGRSDQCTVCVNSDMVSRRHAVINRILGHYIVVDLKSTNGTFVNDQRIERAELKDGDLLRTGKTVLKYLENNIELEYMQHILSLAALDSLTGLYNKRHFDEVFGKEVARADHTREPLSLDRKSTRLN